MGAKVSQELSDAENPVNIEGSRNSISSETETMENGEMETSDDIDTIEEFEFIQNPPILVLNLHGGYYSLSEDKLFKPPFPIIKINASRLGTPNLCNPSIPRDDMYSALGEIELSHDQGMTRKEHSKKFISDVRETVERHDPFRNPKGIEEDAMDHLHNERKEILGKMKVDHDKTAIEKLYMSPGMGDYIRDARNPYKIYTASPHKKTLLNKVYTYEDDDNSIHLIYEKFDKTQKK